MTKFATQDIDPKVKLPVLVWVETDGRYAVESRHASIDDIPEDVDLFVFEVPTTLSVGHATNLGIFPTLDVDGAPLWEGARIKFRVPSYYVNTESGAGAFASVDRYGGATYVSDVALPVNLDRSGAYSDKSTKRYSGFVGFVNDGELKGYRKLSGGIGDPHEHGTTPTFIRLDSDPRDVCVLKPRPALRGP